jgi:ParB-like chromosome segregation protein Spo0J
MMTNSPRFTDRVVELRRVPADTIRPNPWNWRLHPQNQSDALTEMLDEVGFAGALIARETPEGLELIDGHLRQEVAGSAVVPVLVVDMNDEEVRRLLATLDPIGAMAKTDATALSALLETLEVTGESTLLMLDNLVEAVEGEMEAVEGEPDFVLPDGETNTQEPDEMVVVSLRMQNETWERLRPQILALQGEGVLVDVV